MDPGNPRNIIGVLRQNIIKLGSTVIFWWYMMQFYFKADFIARHKNFHCNLLQIEISRE